MIRHSNIIPIIIHNYTPTLELRLRGTQRDNVKMTVTANSGA